MTLFTEKSRTPIGRFLKKVALSVNNIEKRCILIVAFFFFAQHCLTIPRTCDIMSKAGTCRSMNISVEHYCSIVSQAKPKPRKENDYEQ